MMLDTHQVSDCAIIRSWIIYDIENRIQISFACAHHGSYGSIISFFIYDIMGSGLEIDDPITVRGINI